MFDHQIKKVIYSNCDIPEHGSQPLSRVCTDDKCSNKALICSLCQELNHKGHKTTPLKTILSKINNDLDYNQAGISPLYYTKIIDECRTSFFSMVKQKRQEIDSLFSDLDNLGRLYFNKVQQTTRTLLHAESPLKFLNNNEVHNAKKLREYFRKMLNLLTFEDKDGFSLQNKLDSIIEDCRSREKRIKETFQPFTLQLEKTAVKVSATLDCNLEISAKNVVFAWSNEYKGAKVKITDQLAEQTGMESTGQRFATLEPSLTECKYMKYLVGMRKMVWGIKMKKFSGWIGVGICLRNIIKDANYHFNYTNIGHGSYLISSNGYSWSHSVKEFNSTHKTFHYSIDDIVYIEYDPLDNKLRFRKNTSNEKFELNVVPPPPGDCYCACVNLCSTGDSVQVVNPGIALS